MTLPDWHAVLAVLMASSAGEFVEALQGKAEYSIITTGST
jgi:hypothetical protein